MSDQHRTTIMPKFFGNILDSVNSASSILKKSTLGVERLVDGIVDEDKGIATLMLRKQRLALEAELTTSSKQLTAP